MSSEEESKHLLRALETLRGRLAEAEAEVEDLRRAVERVEGLIVSTGFKTFTAEGSKPVQVQAQPQEGVTLLTSRDGVTLGSLRVEGEDLVYEPPPGLEFSVETPPFKTFLLERVLENMRQADEERMKAGELDPDRVLSFQVVEEGGVLKGLRVSNYGGERRMREITSSLRWTLDKMYDKIRKG